MDWTITQLSNFKSEVISMKENYIVQDDGTGDYTIEKRKKDGFTF